MATRVQHLNRGQAIAIVWSGWVLLTSVGICTAASSQSLDWSLHASRNAHYPGEPVLLTLTVRNSGDQGQAVYFEDDLEVSSVEIRNLSGEVLTRGSTINRAGGGIRPTPLQAPPGRTSSRAVVLNRWCSTLLLPAGVYEVVCRVRCRLAPEDPAQPGTGLRGRGSVETEELRVNVSIVQMDLQKFRDRLERLRTQAFPTVFMEKFPTVAEEHTAREMLASTESTLAVPYQLQMLTGGGLTTNVRRDAVNSLARSNTLEAAVGLMKLIENGKSQDVRWDLVQAVYRLRESGQAEIITATDEFIQSHERSLRRWGQVERDVSN